MFINRKRVLTVLRGISSVSMLLGVAEGSEHVKSSVFILAVMSGARGEEAL